MKSIKNQKDRKSLNENGVLIFDFIKGDGEGLDSKNAVVERNDVLKFVEENFTVLKGKINYEESTGRTIVRKKT